MNCRKCNLGWDLCHQEWLTTVTDGRKEGEREGDGQGERNLPNSHIHEQKMELYFFVFFLVIN